MNTENLVYRSAEIVSDSFNHDERTFEISFSSETPVSRGKLFEILDHSSESVDLSHLNTGNAPLLLDHEDTIEKHAGKIVRAWVDATDRKGKALIKLGGSTRAEEVLKNIKADTPPNVSVGYLIRNFIEESKNSFRVTNWVPFEISFVAIPADNTVGFYRSINFSDSVETEEEININNSINIQSPNKESRKMEVQENQVDVQALIAAERKRNSDIQSLAKAFSHVEDIEVLAERSISAGEDVATFQSLILEKMKNVRSNPIAFGQAAQVTDNVENDPKKGFRHLGEFAKVIMQKGRSLDLDSEIMKRAAPSVFANTTTGADGAYLIPEGLAQGVLDIRSDQPNLLDFANKTPLSNGNNMAFPFNPKQPWNGGVTAHWVGEAAAGTQSVAELDILNLKLKKIVATCPITEELQADTSAMGAFLQNGMSRAINWETTDAIVNGNGTTQPLGILNSGALVTIAKETSQDAKTINTANLSKMLAAMLRQGGSGLIWIAHPDTLTQIMGLTLGNTPVYQPDFKISPAGVLLGRPLVLSDAAQTLGTKGDIILANMNGYLAITKANGVEMAESMHLWFDIGVNCFRAIFRMDGSPVLPAPVSPKNGSNSRSDFVALATRA